VLDFLFKIRILVPMLILKGEERDLMVPLKTLRERGFIPAVYYGKKEKATSCFVLLNEFKKVWRQAGKSTVVVLTISDNKFNTLIHDVQLDPVRDQPIHIDFYVLEKGQEVTVHIPIEFMGVAPAVKDLGANLVKTLYEIEVKGVPEKLPHSFIVDISSLSTLDSQISAGSIILPVGVTLITKSEEVIAAIAVAKEEVVESPVVDLASIEVTKKGKKEDEETPVETKSEK